MFFSFSRLLLLLASIFVMIGTLSFKYLVGGTSSKPFLGHSLPIILYLVILLQNLWNINILCSRLWFDGVTLFSRNLSSLRAGDLVCLATGTPVWCWADVSRYFLILCWSPKCHCKPDNLTLQDQVSSVPVSNCSTSTLSTKDKGQRGKELSP